MTINRRNVKWKKVSRFWWITDIEGDTLEVRWFGKRQTSHENVYRVNKKEWQHLPSNETLRDTKLWAIHYAKARYGLDVK